MDNAFRSMEEEDDSVPVSGSAGASIGITVPSIVAGTVGRGVAAATVRSPTEGEGGETPADGGHAASDQPAEDEVLEVLLPRDSSPDVAAIEPIVADPGEQLPDTGDISAPDTPEATAPARGGSALARPDGIATDIRGVPLGADQEWIGGDWRLTGGSPERPVIEPLVAEFRLEESLSAFPGSSRHEAQPAGANNDGGWPEIHEISASQIGGGALQLTIDANAADLVVLNGTPLHVVLAPELQINGSPVGDIIMLMGDLGAVGIETVTVDAGDGANTVNGSTQSNPAVRLYLSGGDSGDVLFGGAGDDVLEGGGAADIMLGGGGDDTLYGGDGNDWMYGGGGHDWLYGGDGNDWLYGDAGDDTLYGGEGDDWLYGDAGDDTLYGGEGNDYLFGGAGADVFAFTLLGGFDTIRDFSAEEGDVIRLDGLLVGLGAVDGDSLDDYLQLSFDFDSERTILRIDAAGGGAFASPDATIVVDSVDFTAGGGSQADMIQALLDNGQLVVV